MEIFKEDMRKFQQSVNDKTWRELRTEAQSRDVSIQELVRVEIIPLWLKSRK